ncbi:hypothetical protein D7Z54_22925 [Salibacterium salarium]|uniref:Uncharacterized protein n=1 Tax=Salibacterium salarium TaxID=284579 RepID=A0A428MXW7_9BACI|nr:hypothetical protein [Salibacterium salarium]RSL31003.1 hypothetical protein D7Z54_22925 [Salibacterium salarium]
MRKVTGVLVFCLMIGCWSTVETKAEVPAVPFQTDIEPPNEQDREKDNKHDLYIDGQLQTYGGSPIFDHGELFVPIQAAIKVLDDKADIDNDAAYADESLVDYLEENDHIEEVDGRDVVLVRTLQNLGIRAEWLDDPGRLHLETADLLTVNNLKIGDSLEEVNNKLDVHWNTGFGKLADYIGFYGDNQEFTYTDRYGKERTGKVPDIQLEILENSLSYIILSSSEYETTRGISVGDTLFDVTRSHGSEFINETADGKTIYIYHVNDGSLWFIADENSEIERIALWGFQLEGFQR